MRPQIGQGVELVRIVVALFVDTETEVKVRLAGKYDHAAVRLQSLIAHPIASARCARSRASVTRGPRTCRTEGAIQRGSLGSMPNAARAIAARS